MTGPLSEETNASQHNLRPKEVLFTGIPVGYLVPSATKWKNCAIVPSGHLTLNTMTTNCDPMRVKVFHMLITCVILMMIDVGMQGQGLVT